jgi:hypothetical protein
MRCMLIVLFFSSIIDSYGQDYVITNEGDSLVGKIKEPLFEYILYQKIVMKNEEKVSFGPAKAERFMFDGVLFESHDIGAKEENKVFLKPIVKGYCSLYEYQYVTQTYLNGIPNTSQPKVTFFVKRQGEKFHEVRFPSLKNGKDFYFIDNGALTYDLRNGKYSKSDIKKIVERYNRESISK